MEEIDLLLINPPFHTRHGGGSFFPLGLAYIISYLNAKNYSWRIIDCQSLVTSFNAVELQEFKKNLSTKLLDYSPKLIGMGPCVTSQLRALEIISSCCRTQFPQIPIFAGGPLATIEGQEWLFYDKLKIDYLIKGDGEYAVANAIHVLNSTGTIANSQMVSKNGYSHTNVIQNIDTILFPYRRIQNTDKFSVRRSAAPGNSQKAAMITSRGCPYSCQYCVSGNFKSLPFRKRSIDNVIQEMEELYYQYHINDLVFYDDCFFPRLETMQDDIRAFCGKVLEKKLKMSWQIELRPDLLSLLSNEFILLLEESGCRQINLGVEKISDKGRAALGKGGQMTEIRSKMLQIREVSQIKLSATFILGGEEETKNDIKLLVKESKTLGLDFAHYNPLFVYPGTPLYIKMFDNNNLNSAFL